MYLENIVFDAVEPQRLGRFWEAVVGGETLTDEPDIFETSMIIEGGPVLDLCFPRVAEPSTEPPRLHLDLSGGARQAEEVDRLLGLGARHLDIGQGDVPWVVLADPEGNPCCVMEDREAYAGSGPIAALPLDSADPDRDAGFWSWLTGWTDVDGVGLRSLRHPSGLGPLLELCPERSPKGATKNRVAPRRPARDRRGARRVRGSHRRARRSAGCTRTGATCRGGPTSTRRATSSASCRRGRDQRVREAGEAGLGLAGHDRLERLGELVRERPVGRVGLERGGQRSSATSCGVSSGISYGRSTSCG